MQSRLSPPATPHSTHDLVLLAAATDRNPDPAIASAAADQVAHCAACAAAATELRALAGGLAELPRERPAPHDMRLTTDKAARLRRGSLWRQVLRPFGREGLPGLRPLAAVLTTFGLAGLLLTTIPLGLGGAAGAPAPALVPVGNGGAGAQASGENDMRGTAANPGATASVVALDSGSKEVASAPPVPESLYAYGLGAGASSPRARSSDDRLAAVDLRTPGLAGPQVPPLTLISLGLAITGLALFAVLVVARRIA